MNWFHRNLLNAAFLSAMLTLVTVSILSYRYVAVVNEANTAVMQTQETILNLETVMSGFRDIEIGEHGFLLTTDTSFMKFYEQGLAKEAGSMTRLENLVTADPAQLGRLHRLNMLMNERIAEVRIILAEMSPEAPEAARKLAQKRNGLVLNEKIRNLAREMSELEQKNLNESLKTVQTQTQSAQNIIFLLSFLSFLLMVVAFVFARRDAMRRQAAEQATHAANEQLNLWVQELEKRNAEVGFLNEVIEILQMCSQTADAYTAIEKSMVKMYPKAAGALYIFNNSRNLLEMAATWNDHQGEPVMTPEDCCALRTGHAHLVREPKSALLCRHLQVDVPGPTKCLPLTAHNEVLGLLHLQFGAMTATEVEMEFRSSRRAFLASVVDHFAISLANLRLRETLRAQSIRDPLTGLFNRRHMEVSLEREVRRATRKETSVGVLLADLDHFKNFNDSFGHDAGDMLLTEVAHILGSTVRAEDIVCRYGGEEFVMILPEVDAAIATARAEALRQAVRGLNLVYGGRSLGKITLSIGVALFPVHGRDGDSVIKTADKALYQAKGEGRDRVVLATEAVVNP